MIEMLKAMRVVLIAAVAALILPAVASAATKVYGGSSDIGGTVAMDVKLNQNGVAKRVTEVRAVDLGGFCEITAAYPDFSILADVDTKVSKKGKFEFKFKDDYGNKSTVSGKFSGKGDNRMKGTFFFAIHLPAEGPYPEENCTAGSAGFKLKKNGPDAVVPLAAARTAR